MGKILVLVQHSEGTPLKASLCAITAAADLKVQWKADEICALTLGSGAEKAANAILGFGIAEAFYSESSEFDKYLASPYSQAVVQVMEKIGASVFVAASTSTGKDLSPRVAIMLDAGQASDIVAVNSDGSLKRPMYAGDVFADVEILTPKKVVTVRVSAFAAAMPSSTGGGCSKVEISLDNPQGEVVGYELSKSERPELGEAEIVVTGGRALQSSENFQKFIFPLADALGAAVGASRAAVDSGYAPNDWQVGQTGKIVAPNLYIACGVSGAIQHLAGMKDSKVIVAINKDPEAPIYEVADFGLVADIFDVLPKLTEEIKRARSS